MAKKQHRSGKPVPGGRVTPKGVRPDGSTNGDGHEARPGATPPRTPPARAEQGHGRRFVSPPGPTRAGHQHGQR
jgi:hypothetical protein